MARMRSSRVGNLLDAALLLERFKGGGDLASGKQLDRGLQRRVFLANDLIELGGAHSGLLQLLEWTACFDALMLAGVADQEHAVVGAKTRKKLAHLVGAGKARFIDKIEMLLFLSGTVWADRARNPCRVPTSMPASPSWRAAREVGAKPSTA